MSTVPISTYEHFVPYIDLITAGEDNVLTAEPVISLKPTSGSTQATKLIPYTESLRHDFKKGILPWIFSLFLSFRKLLFGSAYWSLTPALKSKLTNSGKIPVGFTDDSEYFGTIERRLINSILSVPKEVNEIENLENFHYTTLLFLIKDSNLSFISIWNPTFLINMLRNLPEWLPKIIEDIRSGNISLPFPGDDPVINQLKMKLKPDSKRAKKILAAVLFKTNHVEICKAIWPNLILISCWGNGTSQPYLEKLQYIFPYVRIQKKGLMATEGIISFPIEKYGHVLSIRSHFFEFIEWGHQNETGRSLLSHEIEKGKTYNVILTSGGGLYRYKTGDLIEVVGFINSCPIVRFVGRSDKVSDIFGEKLNENHISSILENEFRTEGLSPSFFMIAPEAFPDGSMQYVLYLEVKPECPTHVLKALAEKIELKMQENYHYAYCRKLEQLRRLRIFLIEEKGMEVYLNSCYLNGLKLGDIKPSALNKKTGWSKIFRGRLIDEEAACEASEMI